MAMKIIRDLCTACGDCSSVCPTDAIIQFKGVYKIEADTCTECDGAEIPQCLDTCMEDGCIVPA
jgi:ferredoxin